MADLADDDGIIKLAYIPEQYLAAGRYAELNLGKYAQIPPDSAALFSIRDFPAGFIIDEKTGVVTGKAPEMQLNESFLVTLVLDDIGNNHQALAIFRIEIIGSFMLATPEGKLLLNDSINFWELIKGWEIELFVQHLIAEHFAFVMIYNAENESNKTGKLQNRRTARSGWDILTYEQAVVITPGNKAFEEYGNRKRLLDTLREAYQLDVSAKNWRAIELEASDIETLGKAWVIGKELNTPLKLEAPSETAEINYANLDRVYGSDTPSRKLEKR